MNSVSIELRKMKKGNALFLAKTTLFVILCRQDAWFQILFVEVRFFKRKGPAAEGKAMGPSLKLEVDLRRKNSEHAMHPLQGAADLKGFAVCRRPPCKRDDLMS